VEKDSPNVFRDRKSVIQPDRKMLMRSLGVDRCSGIGDPGELRIWATVVYSYQLIAIQLPKVDLCAAFCVDHAIRFIPVRKSSLSPETL